MTATAQRPALTLADYFSHAQETDRFVRANHPFDKLRFGFFGEVGGLLAAVKKVSRDQLLESETEVAGEEIGDALWYLVAAAHSVDVTPDQLGRACLREMKKLFGERQRDDGFPINFRQLDGIVAAHSFGLESKRTELLSELAHVSGELVICASASKGKTASALRANLLGKLLGYLALVSASFSLQLEDVAHDNLAKIRGRWPGKDPKYVGLFDDGFEARLCPFLSRIANGLR
jgi:NTP pyrophosphatase (non-canonical NTP hydrolase)